jgi:hypothetical protein
MIRMLISLDKERRATRRHAKEYIRRSRRRRSYGFFAPERTTRYSARR